MRRFWELNFLSNSMIQKCYKLLFYKGFFIKVKMTTHKCFSLRKIDFDIDIIDKTIYIYFWMLGTRARIMTSTSVCQQIVRHYFTYVYVRKEQYLYIFVISHKQCISISITMHFYLESDTKFYLLQFVFYSVPGYFRQIFLFIPERESFLYSFVVWLSCDQSGRIRALRNLWIVRFRCSTLSFEYLGRATYLSGWKESIVVTSA